MTPQLDAETAAAIARVNDKVEKHDYMIRSFERRSQIDAEHIAELYTRIAWLAEPWWKRAFRRRPWWPPRHRRLFRRRRPFP